jgi:hypothetical protein
MGAAEGRYETTKITTVNRRRHYETLRHKRKNKRGM